MPLRTLLLGALYLTVMATGVGGLMQARNWALETQTTAEKKRDWEVWREEAARQAAGKGPVARKVPRSTEPPALVLLRDYFVVCAAAWLVLGSVLFAVSAWMV